MRGIVIAVLLFVLLVSALIVLVNFGVNFAGFIVGVVGFCVSLVAVVGIINDGDYSVYDEDDDDTYEG